MTQARQLGGFKSFRGTRSECRIFARASCNSGPEIEDLAAWRGRPQRRQDLPRLLLEIRLDLLELALDQVQTSADLFHGDAR